MPRYIQTGDDTIHRIITAITSNEDAAFTNLQIVHGIMNYYF